MSLLRKGTITRRGGKPSPLMVLSTVASGSIDPPNSCKPYYYDGYYYVFYKANTTIYYQRSADGKTWEDAVSVATSDYGWSVMGIDDRILLCKVKDNYHKAVVGVIGETISWGTENNLGIRYTGHKRIACYTTKINASRKLFALTTKKHPTLTLATDRLFVSDDDGENWTDLGYCQNFESWFWYQFLCVPFNDGNKVQEIFSPPYNPFFNQYKIASLYRDGSTCSSQITIGGFRNQYYVADQACALLIGSYVHLVYIDNSNSILHKKIVADGSWQTVGTVKSGVNSDAGLTLCYDSTTGKLHIIYFEDTTIKRKVWDGTSYKAEETVVEGETEVARLTTYPSLLNNKIVLIWQNATPDIRFALVKK